VGLTVMRTHRRQESFWLAAYKLKPQRETMLLLAVQKFGTVSWDYLFFFVLVFPGARHAAKMYHHTEIESHLNSELRKGI